MHRGEISREPQVMHPRKTSFLGSASAWRTFQTGRAPTCAIRPAAASIPLQAFLGSRPTTAKHRSVPGQDDRDDYKVPDYSLSAVQQTGSSSASSHQHHVGRGRPFVLGSPPDLLGGSHTQPANSGIAAHGCYRVIGPARISKRGDCLVARLLPGARLELLSSGGSCASAVEAVEDPPRTGGRRANGAAGHSGVQRTVMEAAEAAAHPWGEGEGYDVQCACVEDGYGGAEAGDSANSEAEAAADDGRGSSSGEGENDDGAVAECLLVASYVELGGSASSMDASDEALQLAVRHHNGHTYLCVRSLPESAVITLSADGDLSHPVNVTPGPPQQAA